jgi:hypothetical protein
MDGCEACAEAAPHMAAFRANGVRVIEQRVSRNNPMVRHFGLQKTPTFIVVGVTADGSPYEFAREIGWDRNTVARPNAHLQRANAIARSTQTQPVSQRK